MKNEVNDLVYSKYAINGRETFPTTTVAVIFSGTNKTKFQENQMGRRFLEVEILKCPWVALPGFLFTISYITLFQLGQGFIS